MPLLVDGWQFDDIFFIAELLEAEGGHFLVALMGVLLVAGDNFLEFCFIPVFAVGTVDLLVLLLSAEAGRAARYF